MNETTGPAPAAEPVCIGCGHRFTVHELAAIVARPGAGDQLLVRCASCGAQNELLTEQGQGFETQPTIRVLRIVDVPPGEESVFAETVDPGVKTPAISDSEPEPD